MAIGSTLYSRQPRVRAPTLWRGEEGQLTPPGMASQAPQSSAPSGSTAQPGAYPSRPNYFQPRQPLQPGGTALDRQRGLLGPGADAIIGQGGGPLRRNDVALLELGLNLENLNLAEGDRQRGYEELVRGRSAIGTDPASMLAREVAMRRVSGGNDLKTRRASALKDRTAVATNDSLRQLSQEQAQSGTLQSSGGYLNRARLPQEAAIGLSGQLSDLDFQQEEADRMALGQLDTIGSREAAQQAAFDELIANIFLQTERGPIDLSGLLEELPKRKGESVI